jgi:hypothetical protein
MHFLVFDRFILCYKNSVFTFIILNITHVHSSLMTCTFTQSIACLRLLRFKVLFA